MKDLQKLLVTLAIAMACAFFGMAYMTGDLSSSVAPPQKSTLILEEHMYARDALLKAADLELLQRAWILHPTMGGGEIERANDLLENYKQAMFRLSRYPNASNIEAVRTNAEAFTAKMRGYLGQTNHLTTCKGCKLCGKP